MQSKWSIVTRLLIVSIASFVFVFQSAPPEVQAACTLQNAVMPGADPSIWYRNNTYYLVQSYGENKIYLRSASTIGGLRNATNRLIWTAPSGTAYSTQIWAPELEYLGGRWYIYFAAARDMGDFDSTNRTHRIYAIQANTSNPFGAWTFRGKVQDPTDEWAIDASVFYYNNNYYMIWSGTPPGRAGGFPQQLYIAHMRDPLYVDEPYRKLIGNPDQSWETSVAAIEEAPEAFINPYNNKLTIVYSANASWSRNYNLGMLVYNGGDMGHYSSYTKVGPIFSEANGVYGVGHPSLPVPAPFGFWMVYHAKTTPNDGWEDRQIFAQPHTWNSDGTPNFGVPRGYTSFDEANGQAC